MKKLYLIIVFISMALICNADQSIMSSSPNKVNGPSIMQSRRIYLDNYNLKPSRLKTNDKPLSFPSRYRSGLGVYASDGLGFRIIDGTIPIIPNNEVLGMIDLQPIYGPNSRNGSFNPYELQNRNTNQSISKEGSMNDDTQYYFLNDTLWTKVDEVKIYDNSPVYRALYDIKNAWFSKNSSLIMKHIDPDKSIELFLKGKLQINKDLFPEQLDDMLDIAMHTTTTLTFKWMISEDDVYTAEHIFIDANKVRRIVYASFTLETIGDEAYIIQLGSSNKLKD